MATQFLGSKISLISKSKIRYEGILYTIDPKESTIALAKVRSFGTEDRQTDKPVPSKDEIFEYIIFRASDIEDLVVDMPSSTPSNPGLSDPAIIQAQSMSQHVDNSNMSSTLQSMTSNLAPSTPQVEPSLTDLNPQLNAFESVTNKVTSVTSSTPPFTNVNYTSGNSTPTLEQKRRSPFPGDENKKQQVQSHQNNHHQQQQQQRNNNNKPMNNQFNRTQNRDQRSYQQYRSNGINQNRRPMPPPSQQRGLMQQQQTNFRGRQIMQMNQSRRMPQLNRPSQSYNNYHRVNNAARTKVEPLKIDGDFDFEKANLEFQEIESKLSQVKIVDEEKVEKPINNTNTEIQENKEKGDDENICYDKQKSFFDKISCEALERSKGKINKVDWKKERELNTETFGTVANRRPPFRPRGGYNNYSGYSRPMNHNYRNGPSSGIGGGDQRRSNIGPNSRSTRW